MLVKLFVSILLDVALLLAFVQAPSSHVHAHEATERHIAGFLHTHVPHVEAPLSGHAEWRDFDPDDDAHFLSWVSTAPGGEGLATAILLASYVAPPAPIVVTRQTTVLRPRAHDPPAIKAISPRAPPR